MKEWILENTTVTEEKYNSLINEDTVILDGTEVKKDKNTYELSNNPIINVYKFTEKKPTITRCMIYGIRKSKKYYIYKDIKFRVFAELMKTRKGDFYESLYSEKRLGTCFDKGMTICLSNKNSKIVTAMCIDPFLIPTKKFIHCFVIDTGKDGKEYVIDGTLNAVIEKQKYIDIYNAEIITEIEEPKVFEFLDLMSEGKELGSNIDIAEYLCFPDEVIEGVKKHIKTR